MNLTITIVYMQHIKATGLIGILIKFIVSVVIINGRVRFVPDFENLEGMHKYYSSNGRV